MPPQLKRLVPLFIIFVGLFLLARYLLIPESFGEYGHYRGNSLIDNAAHEPRYAGSKICADCHEEISLGKASDLHAEISCESCHGACQSHVNDYENVRVDKPSGREFCALCHAINPARKKNTVTQIDPAEHNIDHDCIECHNPHLPCEIKDLDNPGETF